MQKVRQEWKLRMSIFVFVLFFSFLQSGWKASAIFFPNIFFMKYPKSFPSLTFSNISIISGRTSQERKQRMWFSRILNVSLSSASIALISRIIRMKNDMFQLGNYLIKLWTSLTILSSRFSSSLLSDRQIFTTGWCLELQLDRRSSSSSLLNLKF